MLAKFLQHKIHPFVKDQGCGQGLLPFFLNTVVCCGGPSTYFLALLLPALGQSQSAQIDALFEDWKNGPGGAVGVVSKGKLVFSKGYGFANITQRILNTPQTVYDLASVSKQFTALVLPHLRPGIGPRP